MKNFEKFEKEIMEITGKGYAVASNNNKLTDCGSIICPECDWSSYNNKDSFCCSARKMLWLYQEYVDKPKLTKKEKQFVDLMGTKMHLVRDKNDTLFLCVVRPYKETVGWGGSVFLRMEHFDNLKFDFIKWEDEEPWSIEELLKLEVEE